MAIGLSTDQKLLHNEIDWIHSKYHLVKKQNHDANQSVSS